MLDIQLVRRDAEHEVMTNVRGHEAAGRRAARRTRAWRMGRSICANMRSTSVRSGSDDSSASACARAPAVSDSVIARRRVPDPRAREGDRLHLSHPIPNQSEQPRIRSSNASMAARVSYCSSKRSNSIGLDDTADDEAVFGVIDDDLVVDESVEAFRIARTSAARASLSTVVARCVADPAGDAEAFGRPAMPAVSPERSQGVPCQL
jgi:hypothetical protein